MIGLHEQAVLVDSEGMRHGTLGALPSQPERGRAVYHARCHHTHNQHAFEQSRLDLKRTGWLMG
jgi:hypothetical protein